MISKLLQDFKEIQMVLISDIYVSYHLFLLLVSGNFMLSSQRPARPLTANSQQDGAAYSTHLLGFSTSLEKQLWQAG